MEKFEEVVFSIPTGKREENKKRRVNKEKKEGRRVKKGKKREEMRIGKTIDVNVVH